MHPFEAIKISDRVYWVGAIDWDLRNFHGYHTSRGTTYNAFLITGEKPILIDTVKEPFFEEMLARVTSVMDPKKISYIISNHSEMDHSGSLLKMIEAVEPEKIFASKMGIDALQKHFHANLKIDQINSGSQFQLGDAKFTCLETRMLHWPDSMFTFFENDGILFSQDGFGMHFATDKLLASQNNPHIVRYESAKYFANILLPYSSFVLKLLDQIPSLKLNIKMIAPDHGPFWDTKEGIESILRLWKEWAEQKPTQKIVIAYDTMWHSTAEMAKSFSDGVMSEGVLTKVLNMTLTHRSDAITEILEAGALLLGSPTLNKQIFPTMADLICYTKGLEPKNLIGQAFGSYGWSNAATPILVNSLNEIGVKLIGEPIAVNYVPTDEDLVKCRDLGKQVASTLKKED